MAQQEVLKLLKKDKKRWYSTREIAENLDITLSLSNVCNNLNRLLKHKEVVLKETQSNKPNL